MAVDCPYCEGRQVYFIANTNLKVPCNFCFKGVIPKTLREEKMRQRPGLLTRILSFFRPDILEP